MVRFVDPLDMWAPLVEAGQKWGHRMVISASRKGLHARCSCGYLSPRVGSEDQGQQLGAAHLVRAIRTAQEQERARREVIDRATRAGRARASS